ncbi:MAG: class I SAM-dependent methyltransferase [Burkholderiaceae bacterium]|nr:class I SAM-dependent methyltransferase [Burkholderiaceae bacterium]
MKPVDDREAMAARYARRHALPADRYSPFNPEVQARVQERQRATTRLLRDVGLQSVAGLDILEVGCGTGSNLLEWLQLGAAPERLAGNELLPERMAQAQQRLPAAVRLHAGDATRLPQPEASFDIVHQSTVFSSLLDDSFQSELAARMWAWVRPGGGVLWYDFTFNNPRNADVRGVPLARVRALFPVAQVQAHRITLAPPVARAVCRVHPALYPVFNALPPLRTHLLAWLGKPARP